MTSQRVDNNGTISAEGGTLVINTDTTPDIDGAAAADGNGVLNAVDGNITIENDVNEPFNGQINIGAGRLFQLTAVGDGIDLETDAAINFAGGTYSADLLNQGGALTASSLPSTISADNITFETTGTNTINADLVADGNIMVELGATFNGTAALVNAASSTMTIENSTTIGVNLLSRGRLILGSSPGAALVNKFEQTSAGALEIEVDGTLLGEFDRLIIINLAELAGTLELQPSIVPNYGDSFVIMSFAGSNGNFSSITGAFVNNDLTLAPIFSPTALTLIAALPGDGNLNGTVNFDDFVLLSNSFGAADTFWEEGNYDLNGITNFADFVILSNHFGLSIPSGNPIPEPNCAAIVMLGTLFIVRRYA